MATPEPGQAQGSGTSAGRDVNQAGHINAGRDVVASRDVIINSYPQSPRRPVAMLRRDVSRFIGRAADLADLVSWLDPQSNPAPLVNVHNGPGSGKTALALHAAHTVAPRYPDAQLFLQMAQAGMPALDVSEALRRLLIMLGQEERAIPDGLTGRAGLFQAELPDQALLVLDNVMSADQIEDLLPGRPGCAVLITSPYSFTELEGIREMDLGRMPDDEAHALLEDRLGAGRVASDPEAARQIVQLCGALPLALHLAGAQLTKPAGRNMPLARFAARLADERARLDLLKIDHRDLRASISLSYQALSPAGARLFRLLAVIRVPDFLDELAYAADGTGHAEEAFGELLNAHLIEPAGDGRARFHDLVRMFAGECAEQEDSEGDRDAALERAFAWCTGLAERQGAHVGVDGRRDADEAAYAGALAELGAEREVLLAAIRQAAGTGRDDVPWRITAGLAGFFEVRGHWADWLEAAGISVTCAARLGDPEALGTALYLRSWPLRLMRRTTEAVQDAVAALRELERVPGAGYRRADVLSVLGTLYRELHRHDEAVRCLDEAAGIFRELGDGHGEGLVLRTLGHVQFWRRDLTGAQATLDRAVQLLRQAGDRAGEGWSHNNLCSVHGAAWRYQDALAHFEQARVIFTAIGHQQGLAWAWNHLGRIHRQYGRTREATDCNERALGMFRDLRDDYGTGWALLHLGAARRDTALIEQALGVFTAMSVPEDDGQGWALIWLARLRRDPELTGEAIRHFEVFGSLQGQGTALSARGDIERAAGQIDLAGRSYESALAPLRRCGDLHQEALTRLGLSELARQAGDTDAARELRESALAALTRLGAPEAADPAPEGT